MLRRPPGSRPGSPDASWAAPHPRFLILATFAHALISLAVFLVSFGQAMRRVDTGATAGIGERILSGLSSALFLPPMEPLARALPGLFPGLIGYVPLLLNSLLWAVAIWYGRQAWLLTARRGSAGGAGRW